MLQAVSQMEEETQAAVGYIVGCLPSLCKKCSAAAAPFLVAAADAALVEQLNCLTPRVNAFHQSVAFQVKHQKTQKEMHAHACSSRCCSSCFCMQLLLWELLLQHLHAHVCSSSCCRSWMQLLHATTTSPTKTFSLPAAANENTH